MDSRTRQYSNGSMYAEEARNLIVGPGSYDVIVAGGGVAGIAAAISAARAGSKVLLVERMYAVGGLATLGLITIFLPLCDGNGHQLCYGLAEELLRLSISHGWERDYPATWMNGESVHGEERFQVRYNAQVFALLAEMLLRKSGVQILYGTQICSVIRKDDRVEAIVVENKSGRSAIPARMFVDATGDADLFSLAGAPTALYGRGNIPAAWYYETLNGRTTLHMVGAADVLPNEKDTVVPDAIEIERISGLDAAEVSEAIQRGHSVILEKFLEKGGVSEEHSLATIATIPQLRMTRRIIGACTLDESDDHKAFDDSIGMTGDWRKRGPAFEIPFGTLHAPSLSNVLAAGRCISVTDAMWDVARVIPPAIVTGEAAGLAAALFDDVRSADVDELQERLCGQHVRLHLEDVL